MLYLYIQKYIVILQSKMFETEMDRGANDKSVETEHKALKYAERILPEAEKALEKHYSAKDKTGFRFMHRPMREEDHYPLGVKKELTPAENVPRVTGVAERSKWTTDSRQNKAISEHAGLSNFETPEGAAKIVGDRIRDARNVGGDEEADQVAEKYGVYICQFDYKKTSGLIGESNRNRHFDFLPFKDWSPEQDFNEDFGYKHYSEFYKFEEE